MMMTVRRDTTNTILEVIIFNHLILKVIQRMTCYFLKFHLLNPD